MANFLVNSPSSETVGSNTSDLFDLDVLDGVSVFGVEGGDTITAAAAINASAARLNGGKGADTITLSGGSLDKSQLYGGMGKDVIDTEGQGFTGSVIRGGAGLDTMRFSALALDSTTINGNDMADVLTAQFNAGVEKSLFAAGLGKDVLSAVFVSGSDAFSINGGAGHDSLTVDLVGEGRLSATNVQGGAGIDTIIFGITASEGLTGASLVNGGDQNDKITFSGDLAATVGTATIAGGLGADTLQFVGDANQLTNGFINAGAGLDSVYFSGSFGGGTLNGGAGIDSITLNVFATGGGTPRNAGVMFGDAGADIFTLGSATYTQDESDTGVTVLNTGGGSILGYSDFSHSKLGEMDVVTVGLDLAVASGISASAVLFNISQDVITASAGTDLSVAAFSGTDGVAVFTSTFSTNLTARVEQLDKTLAVGQVIGFTDNNSNYYVFMQGGAAGSGTDGDLLLEVSTAVDGIAVSANSAISIRVAE